MNTRKALAIVISSIGLALASQTTFASTDHLVTHAQLNQIKIGDSAAHVSQVLGAPEDVTTWFGGTHSMDYEISSHSDMQRIVYVDLDSNNKVSGVQELSRE